MTNRFTLRIAALALKTASVLAISIATTSVAQAATAKQSFAIPAQNAAAALEAFGKQSGQSIIFDREALGGKQTKAINGRFSAKEALDRMLRDTGLVMKVVNSGAFVVSVGPQKAKPPKKVAVAAPKPQTAAPAPDVENAESANEAETKEIIVTGTRLNAEFTGAAPVRKIDREKAAAGGLLETAEILRTQPQVSGPRSQLRYSEGQAFGGSRGGAGAGSQTIALRGLSPSQTLVLLNGRRLPAAGVEGVPRSADLSLIPSGLISSVSILTDGASPVYGTDAIAGIVDVKLRQDVDRTSIYATLSQPEAGGGTVGVLSLSTGKTFDRGFIAFGGEYRISQGLELRRARVAGPRCPAFYDKYADGSFAENNLFGSQLPGTPETPCQRSFNTFTAMFSIPSGQLYYGTPGKTNIGVPGFSTDEVSYFAGISAPTRLGLRQFDSNANGVLDQEKFNAELDFLEPGDNFFPDPDGDGLVGFDRQAPIYNLWQQDRARRSTLISPLRQINLFTYGQRDTDILGSATLFFEASFNQRRTTQRTLGNVISASTLGAIVPIANPTNPCGTERNLCYSEITNEAINVEVNPFVTIAGDGDQVTTRIRQYRFVGGLRGDFGLLNGLGGDSLGFANWKYEVSVNAGRSQGKSRRPLFLKDRLVLSLETTRRDPISGQLVCGVDNDGDDLPDDPSSCVPVNLFSDDAFYRNRLTPAETNYLLGSLDYRTQVDLLQFSAFVSGDAINLPAGPINWVLGSEFRRDGIDASGNDIARNQNAASSLVFTDPGAKGSRQIKEIFGEIGIPVMKERPFFHALNLSLAGRVTNEQFSGPNATYSLRGRYEPVPWLAIRGTYGTSFRSPNSYELFTQPFLQNFPVAFLDPCVVPSEASEGGTYNAALDPRSAVLLARCGASGVDPKALGLNSSDVPEAGVLERGSALDDLKPERSTALTAGAVLTLDDQFWPQGGFFDKFGLNLSATYYQIKIRDEIQEGDVFSVIGDCLIRPEGSRYCARITRGSDGFITNVREGFVNGNSRKSEGIDFNMLLQKGFRIGSRPFDFSFDLAGNYELSVLSSLGGDTEFSGTFGYPKLKMNATAQLRQGSWIGTWFTNFVGKSSTFPAFRFEEGVYPSCPPITNKTCTPVQDTRPYFNHNLSFGYVNAAWQLTFGVNNVFDVAPPRLSGLVIGGTPLNTVFDGNYDIYGRTFTFQVRRTF
jgi:iron complex outermembrane recepter protein